MRHIAILLMAISSAWGQGATPLVPAISASNTAMTMDVGLGNKTFTVTVLGRNLPAAEMAAEIAVTDRGQPSGSAVTVEVPKGEISELKSGLKDGRDWWVPVTVKGLPKNTKETRLLRVKLGSLERDIEFSVSNQASAEYKWTITPAPNPWVIFGERGRVLSVPIVLGANGASSVTVTHQLVEDKTKRLLRADALSLCAAESGECGTVRGAANSTVMSYLRFGGDVTPGKYTGPVFFTTPEKAAPENVSFNLQMSSRCYYLLGIAVLVFGVYLGWVMSAYVAARLARLAALDLVQPVQAAVLALAKKWEPVGDVGGMIRGKLEELAASLQEGALADLLPPSTPEIFPRNRAARLQERLDAVGKRLKIATLVFDRGWTRIAGDRVTDELKTALRGLEALALRDAEVKDVEAGIVTILDTYLQAVAPRLVGAANIPPQAIVPIEEEEIRRGFAELNQLGWAVWALLTILGGFYLFIMDKPAFGLISDYIVCLFWGVGLPATADKLTPAGVLQTLSVSKPK